MDRDTGLTDNFKFKLFGCDTPHEFIGYISSTDPTTAKLGVLRRGSKNTYKKSSGTVGNRPGLLLRGAADSTLAGVDSSFEWNSSRAITYPLRVSNGKLQVESDVVTAGTFLWYDLLTASPTRFVFDAWWDDANKKDRLVFVDGDGNLYSWSGGLGAIASTTANTIVLTGSSSAVAQGFDASGTQQVVINGNTYNYTAAGSSGNTAYTQSPTNANVSITSTSIIGQSFTTGASATQIIAATVTIKALAISNDSDATFELAIYSDNAGVPGTKLGAAVGSIPHAFSAGDFTVSVTLNVTASPLTTYHLVISGVSVPVTCQTYIGVSGAVGTNVSTNAGITWSASNGYLNATVTENTVSPQTLVGVSPNPTGEVNASLVLQKVVTNTSRPALGFSCDFLKVIGNQVHIGSYSSRLVYISKDTNYAEFTVPDVRVAGDPDILTLDSNVNGITVQKQNATTQVAVISGSEGDWYTILRSNITVGTTLTEDVQVVKSETADLQTALAHEFIDTVGDSILFLDQSNQLRQYGTVRNIVTPVYPELSLDVQDELAGVDFTGGHLRVATDGEGAMVVYATAPLIGTDYMYQVRQRIDESGNLTAERLWHPPQIRNLSRIAIIDGQIFGHSNSNPQLYQLWNTGQWHDDSPSATDTGVPYECIAAFVYDSGDNRVLQEKFDKIFFEGYLTEGTDLFGKAYLDYQGATALYDIVVNNRDHLAKTYVGQNAISLGDKSLGDDPLGDSVNESNDDQELVPKFRTIVGVEEADCFEHSLLAWSNQLDARWELLCLGTNAVPSLNTPDELMQ